MCLNYKEIESKISTKASMSKLTNSQDIAIKETNFNEMIKASKFCIDDEDNLLCNKSVESACHLFDNELVNDQIIEPRVNKFIKKDHLDEAKRCKYAKSGSVYDFEQNFNQNFQENLSSFDLEISKSIDQNNEDAIKIFDIQSPKPKDMNMVTNDICQEKKENIYIQSNLTNNFNNSTGGISNVLNNSVGGISNVLNNNVGGISNVLNNSVGAMSNVSNNSVDDIGNVLNNILAPLQQEAEALENIYNNKIDCNNQKDYCKSTQLLGDLESLFNADKITPQSKEINLSWYNIFGNEITLDDLKNIHALLFEYYKLVK